VAEWFQVTSALIWGRSYFINYLNRKEDEKR
jgi:hypothetical protein